MTDSRYYGFRFGRISLKTGVEIHYAEGGEGSGEACIFLHGYVDSWHSFRMILAALPQKLHLFAPDLRGHGDSDKPCAPYTLETFTEDLLEFLNTLGLKRANLIGHSMGSLIAQSFAASYPSRVERLVLIGSASSTVGNEAMTQLKPPIDALQDPVDSGFVAQFQTPSNPIPEDFMGEIISESLKVPAHVWKNALSGLLQVDNRPILHCITAPTLILWGNQDAIFMRKDQADLLERITDSKLIEYEAGHGLHWEKPDEVASVIGRFLTSPSIPLS